MSLNPQVEVWAAATVSAAGAFVSQSGKFSSVALVGSTYALTLLPDQGVDAAERFVVLSSTDASAADRTVSLNTAAASDTVLVVQGFNAGAAGPCAFSIVVLKKRTG